jgi:hypothetical protein
VEETALLISSPFSSGFEGAARRRCRPKIVSRTSMMVRTLTLCIEIVQSKMMRTRGQRHCLPTLPQENSSIFVCVKLAQAVLALKGLQTISRSEEGIVYSTASAKL